MTKLGRALDKIGKVANWIRAAGFILLLIFFLLSLVKHGFNRKEIEQLVTRTTGLSIRNDILHNHIDERDSLLVEKQDIIDNLKLSIDSSETRVTSLAVAYSKLENEFDKLADSIIIIPTDSSYKFLTQTAYPYPGPRNFPFSEPQVKGIHLTWMERTSLADMNLNLGNTIHELNDQLLLQDSVAANSEQKMILMQASTADYKDIIVNKDEIIDGQDKFIQKKKKQTRIGQFVAGAVIVVLAILAGGS